MTWPTASVDTELVDGLAAWLAASPVWASLDPLAGAVFVWEWPDAMPLGPRACIHPPQLAAEATAAGTVDWHGSVIVEVQLPVGAAMAIAALGAIRDAIATTAEDALPGHRILRVDVGNVERGKISNAKPASLATDDPETEAPFVTISGLAPEAWKLTSSVAHRGEIRVQVRRV